MVVQSKNHYFFKGLLPKNLKTKFILFTFIVNIFLFFSSSHAFSTANNNLYILGINENDEEERIGVKGVPYYINPQDHNDLYLTTNGTSVALTTNVNKHCLFTFEEVENVLLHFYLMHFTSAQLMKDQEKDQCIIDIKSSHNKTLHFIFKEHADDCRPSVLQYMLATKCCSIKRLNNENDNSHAWKLRPAYEFLKLDLDKIDPETLLFK